MIGNCPSREHVMLISLQQFVERLTHCGLFSAEELSAFEDSLPPEKRPQDAGGLARELILAERLTRFQAEAVYRGHTKGLVMGEYVVLDKIGAGGMGEVLKARHRRMDRVVALKILPSNAVSSPGAVKRFRREVKAAARLEHPNIVIAHDAGESDGIHFLAMEYVEGLDFSKLVRCLGPLPIADACELIRQAALGLQHTHEHGLIHRDIKPSNLMLAAVGQVKILDLGLALLPHESLQGGEEITSSGQAVGTLDYMAPEQATDSHDVDIRADIYSLGASLYELLAGQVPFSGRRFDSPVKKIMALATEPVPPIKRLRDDVPEALADVIHRMLAKNPDDRFSTPSEVVAALAPFAAECDLDRLLAQARQAAASSTPGEKSLGSTDEYRSSALVGTKSGRRFVPQAAPRHVRRRWKPFVIVVALLPFAVILFGAVIWINRTKPVVPDEPAVDQRKRGASEFSFGPSEVYVINHSVTMILKTRPQEVIRHHGIKLASEQREKITKADLQYLAQENPNGYQVFCFPNRGAMLLTWIGHADGNGQVGLRVWNGSQWKASTEAYRNLMKAVEPTKHSEAVYRPPSEETIYVLVNCTGGRVYTDAVFGAVRLLWAKTAVDGYGPS